MTDRSSSGREGNKLTQCFDDILRISAELLIQQQLKTIKIDEKITSGYSIGQQRLLQEKVSQFNCMLDSLDVSLQKTTEYVGAVMESAMEVKRKREVEEREQREMQERLEKEKQERQRLEEERLSGKNTPMGILGNFEGEISGSVGNGGKGYGSEFRDLNEMDLSMFDAMDGQSGFGGLQNGGRTDNSGSSSGGIGTDTGTGTSQANDIQRSNDNNGRVENNVDLKSSTESQTTFADTNTAPSNITVSQNGPDSYLTLNDFNDLGIDWNTSNDINDLNLEDFNL